MNNDLVDELWECIEELKLSVKCLKARIAELEAELLKSHTALSMVLNPRTPSDIILAVKYLEGLK